jgi:hypothetical protein
METSCGDGADDDCDGLTDCADPDCEGVACDDGQYCNGTDLCAAGTCGGHAGDPCVAGSTCDESLDRCIGCSVTGCPADVIGAWSACGDFTDICDPSGERTRSVTRYTCTDDACDPSTSVETEACTRGSRAGLTCGSDSFGSWGACSYSSTCDELGEQSRNVYRHECNGSGICASLFTPESRSCATRDTDGNSCGAPSVSWSGTCNYASVCAEDGTESGVSYDRECALGSCVTSSTPTSRACGARVTEGDACSGCGSTHCACFSEACDNATLVTAELGSSLGTGSQFDISCGGSECTARGPGVSTCQIRCPWVSGGAVVNVFCGSSPTQISYLGTINAFSDTCSALSLPAYTGSCTGRAGNSGSREWMAVICQ